ncbi:branched-chain amino acid ABC transporter permease [Actinocrinis sp.]|uniref:branched-chain amino acid ABC transporter permease n=1 Tax=Actinocrinis sp. TaxID=1920516 RepID=UPI002D3399D5|nr:branched-chain amino acid ABC transporter permease [Actinocrinis sp.]HZP54145.1 branched-chain amino acid ABC transporter permease [Actinocrinis sp.]
MSRAGVIRALLFFGVLTALPFAVTAHWIVNLGVFTLIYAGLASAWNLVGGLAGYPSLGHAAFFGAGAYAEAIYFQHRDAGANGLMPFLVLPIVGAGVAVLGLAVGWIAMRTRSDVFAIVTITLLFVAQTLAFNLNSLTGGSQGIGMPPAPFDVDTYERPFYLVLVLLLAVSMGVTWAALHSGAGLSLQAVAADEERARGIGVHVTGVKLLAFAVSVGIAGMIGGVWAYYVSFIYPQFAVDPLITIGMVLMAYLGGRGTLWGPVLGAFVLVPAQQYLAYQYGATQLYLIAYAAVFLLIMLLLPRGILPSLSHLLRRRHAATGRSPDETTQDPADAASTEAGTVAEEMAR